VGAGWQNVLALCREDRMTCLVQPWHSPPPEVHAHPVERTAAACCPAAANLLLLLQLYHSLCLAWRGLGTGLLSTAVCLLGWVVLSLSFSKVSCPTDTAALGGLLAPCPARAFAEDATPSPCPAILAVQTAACLGMSQQTTSQVSSALQYCSAIEARLRDLSGDPSWRRQHGSSSSSSGSSTPAE